MDAAAFSDTESSVPDPDDSSREAMTGEAISRVIPGQRLLKFQAPEILFGEDALVEAANAAQRLGAQRPMLVSDAGLVDAGWFAELLVHLSRAGLSAQIWCGVTPNPKDHEIHEGYRAYAHHGCDVLIALGGGSVIDAAKGIAILAANGGNILEYEGIDKARNSIPPLVVIPTTSGSGADVSQFCIVTDTARKTKITILGRSLVPDTTIIDPRLLVTMPDWLNAATGLEAMANGIEAFVSLGHNPLTDHHALRAVSLVARNLIHTLEEPKFLPGRALMAQASLEAGLSFTNAILGAAQAMSHPVGGLLDAPYGVIAGVVLPHVIRFNAETDPRPYVAIASCLGLPECMGRPSEAAAAVAAFVERLARQVGLPSGLQALGVREEDIPGLASFAVKAPSMMTNPRSADEREMQTLFRTAL